MENTAFQQTDMVKDCLGLQLEIKQAVKLKPIFWAHLYATLYVSIYVDQDFCYIWWLLMEPFFL